METPRVFRQRAGMFVAVGTLTVLLAGCRMGDPYRYAGESHSEAKAIADRWIVRNTMHPGLWEQREPEIQSHVLGRDAWRFEYMRQGHGKLCVYVWWDDYRDDDYAVSGMCP